MPASQPSAAASDTAVIDPLAAALAERALARLRAASAQARDALEDPGLVARVVRVAVVSDFAIDTLVRQPALLLALAGDDGAAEPAPPELPPEHRSDWGTRLRRYRAAGSTRLIWRDALGLDRVEDTLAGSTALAERCLDSALRALEDEFARQRGSVRTRDGEAVRLVVFGLGKLGGGELNFSSDVDLVYAYEHDGSTEFDGRDPARALDAEAYFARLGQQLARLLDEITGEGFCHRVDLRLRPYGNAGRVAWSFTAMEQYFQREGRDWERYAWQKARPVAGDIEAGERFLAALRPFVYRRYLDFGALDGLRTMKAAISAEVARKELADDIKRGPGGIREIEFLVQALQLIRGGREPELRGRRLQPALRELVAQRQIGETAGADLAEAYRFLRRLENRLQMLRDAQTHALPATAEDRARIALGLDYPDWEALQAQLAHHRERVTAEFEALLAPRRRRAAPDALTAYWRALPEAGEAAVLDEAGFEPAADADAALRDFARSPGVRGLSDAARVRLDRVLPALLHGAAGSTQPMLALKRLLALLHNVLRRSAYLALLDEQPAALTRLVEVVSRSALLAERLASHPLLLDELLDARVVGPLPGREELLAACAEVDGGDDAEATLQALNEVRQSLSFRIAMALRDGRQSAEDSARQLAWLADGVVVRILALAESEVASAHGRIAGGRFAVLGYGSLGGEELGFGSDLDLVFLYDAPAVEGGAWSDGARSLDAPRWFARLAQKVVALLGAVTAAGRLFDVDVRLRPDGAKGLLVSSLASFSEYQFERAWTWEHQALVRARFVAGDAGLGERFEAVRAQALARPRDPDKLREEVAAMRARMRAELDRSDAAHFDLKQGEGGLVDLEFLLQHRVLGDSAQAPALLRPRDTPGLIEAARAAGRLGDAQAQALAAAHGVLLAAGLECTLDRRPRRVAETAPIQAARAAIDAAMREQGLRGAGS
ncbi:bifunctional [glutamate--ammonia ligase]-adenylyl-L-tyrosine phosphorylase/[glutamate--ammonia-ligase] adenylyltransferase [Lysobacter sp. BMK333-48F3]|uniref:bifunctional [glutamate--ammonia ligase]-adenylyl-L-tyrosine phosphorylase/[glutamate--ammonia-ligase] adenylyltransferase n=1 Tax=Lysobacter sp. BMK333-48F3 TaxID=2867962 RepID=UPI001C8BE9FC|nr:bifunctional [glutamate--ammonia ligase]-adenylyl-L-tyrosine phosphorylase/[glutamate--ammonia-ligase] adenylyltransferase [Lysobacter sp. BMK333-48F3]MBX9401735.1 bifunctional [glutamate--ammonia ligase]-adenylyl-L-tyrosine phosphorylase/[glutamate--ammonia-ligase] adenylyltransferase [Lysobacter sp. BMK333-48F3]